MIVTHVPQQWLLVLSRCSFSFLGDYWQKTDLHNVRECVSGESDFGEDRDLCVSDCPSDDQKMISDCLVHKKNKFVRYNNVPDNSFNSPE